MRYLAFAAIAIALSGCAPSTPTPMSVDARAVTLTVAPTAINTPTALPSATATVTATSQPTETVIPSLTPKPTITTAPSPTPWPRDGLIYIDSAIETPIRAALKRLESCSPATYKTVTDTINKIFLDDSIKTAQSLHYQKYVSVPSVYFTRTDLSLNLREFNVMRMLVHETYHIKYQSSDEKAANAFTIPVYEDCGSTVPPEDQAALAAMRAYYIGY